MCDCFQYITRILLFDSVGWLYLKAAKYWIIIFLFQADIFQEFTLKEDLVGFQVNLTVLLDCLNIFGMSAVPGKKPVWNLNKKIESQMWSLIPAFFIFYF